MAYATEYRTKTRSLATKIICLGSIEAPTLVSDEYLFDVASMPKLISCDPEKCLGCQICEFACAVIKEKKIDPSFSRIHAVNLEPIGSMALTCISCEKPACVTACIRKALHRTEEGIIKVDEEKCNGCGWCISSCKFGAIGIHPTKRTVIICDFCDGKPKCVESCPFDDALSYLSLDETADKSRKSSIARLLQELATKPRERA